jgi:hypothetical protein
MQEESGLAEQEIVYFLICGLEPSDLGDKTSLLTAWTGNWRGAKKVKFEEG